MPEILILALKLVFVVVMFIASYRLFILSRSTFINIVSFVLIVCAWLLLYLTLGPVVIPFIASFIEVLIS